jgi:hypothetical protein
LALAGEALRTRLSTTWGLDPHRSAWMPKCDVVVHPSQAAYGAAIGRAGDASVGSTRIQFDGERVVARRIDLRCDSADWTNAALPHELAHVVLAERFRGRALPPWADEGMAMLCESPAKHEVRLADLQHALQDLSTYSIRELLSLRTPPPPHLRDAFYGQSLALTSWLVERSTPQKFAKFLESCQERDVDQALRTELAIRGIEDLERQWRDWTRVPAKMAVRGPWDTDVAMKLAALTRDE